MGGDLIQTPQTRWIQGAYESVPKGTIIPLIAQVAAAAGARRYSTFRKFSDTSGYAVTSAKTLFITRAVVFGTAAAMTWLNYYGDNDVGANSAAAPTNAVNIDGDPTNLHNILEIAAANIVYDWPYYMTVPAGKYLTMSHSAGSDRITVMYIGHEE